MSSSELLFNVVLIGQGIGLLFLARLIGSWWLLLVPVVGWPLFLVGVAKDWWEVEFFDTEAGYTLAFPFAVLGAVGVVVGQVLHRPRKEAR